MGKRNKHAAKSAPGGQPIGSSALATRQLQPPEAARPPHPPAKQPTLLAVSVVLFALWFVFLLVTAVFG